MSRDDREQSRMLDIYREARAPDSAVQSRVWRSVEATIGPAPALPTRGEPAASAAPASSAGAKLVALASLIALGGGLGWLATAPEQRAPAQPPRPAAREARSAPAEVATPQAAGRLAVHEAPTASEGAALDAAANAGAVDVRSPAAVKPRSGVAEATSTLAKELKLVASAQAALLAGRHAHALGLLRRHARRFPAGALAEEREATLVETLCALGRKVDAATAAARFVARFPGSPRSSRVREACAEAAP